MYVRRAIRLQMTRSNKNSLNGKDHVELKGIEDHIFKSFNKKNQSRLGMNVETLFIQSLPIYTNCIIQIAFYMKKAFKPTVEDDMCPIYVNFFSLLNLLPCVYGNV